MTDISTIRFYIDIIDGLSKNTINNFDNMSDFYENKYIINKIRSYIIDNNIHLDDKMINLNKIKMNEDIKRYKKVDLYNELSYLSSMNMEIDGIKKEITDFIIEIYNNKIYIDDELRYIIHNNRKLEVNNISIKDRNNQFNLLFSLEKNI